MTWTCGECGRADGQKETGTGGDFEVAVNALCHHCGKPLCNLDRDVGSCQLWIPDDAFCADGKPLPPACHCRDCARTHHPGATAESPRDVARDLEAVA